MKSGRISTAVEIDGRRGIGNHLKSWSEPEYCLNIGGVQLGKIVFEWPIDPWLVQPYHEQLDPLQALLRTDVMGKPQWSREDDPELFDQIVACDTFFRNYSSGQEPYWIGNSYPRWVNRWMTDTLMLSKIKDSYPDAHQALVAIRGRLV